MAAKVAGIAIVAGVNSKSGGAKTALRSAVVPDTLSLIQQLDPLIAPRIIKTR